jgi:hypothetical protein
MRIDYCDWADCPKMTMALYSVKNLTTGVTMYFCAKHFADFQAEESRA